MMMDTGSLLRRVSDSFFPVVAMAAFMLFSLTLLSAATENSSQFGRLHLALVVLNALGLIGLVGLIAVNFVRLIQQYRRKVIGSRLTSRLIVIFVLIALGPVTLVYYFSLGFLQKGIDSWFDVRVDDAMRDALSLSRSSLDLRLRELLRQTRAMSDELVDVPDALVLLSLNDLRARSSATELTLLTRNGRIIASSSADTTAIIPKRPGENILAQVRLENSYAGLEPIKDIGLHVQVAVGVDSLETTIEPRVLYAIYPVPERIDQLANSVQSVYAKHKELLYLREPLKNSFTLTLSLVLLLSLLTAIWAAFFSAQRLVAPIRILAIGTKAVAAGNYEKKLPVTSQDELGGLVQSFSDMTSRLASARDQAQKSQLQVEQERAYLRAVLGRLSSGVITLNSQLQLRVVNEMAAQILEIDVAEVAGKALISFVDNNANLKEFVNYLSASLRKGMHESHQEVVIPARRGNKIIMCHAAQLPIEQEQTGGYVVVIEDVTQLVRVQREAAWGEVARRLAHEIKNPLTPIQLSAERLRRKYLDKMAPGDAEVLDRSTHTIVAQVEAMKEMVKAFSEYARAPKLQLQELHLEQLVDEVLELYRDESLHVSFNVHAQDDLPVVRADHGRIRQLLHNLIKNAIEAMSNMESKAIRIDIVLQSLWEGNHHWLELRVIDYGPGVPGQLIDKLFEPYTTTKSKGSGLGLAVVKRIVEEHSGVVFIDTEVRRGLCMVVRLPVISQAELDATVSPEGKGEHLGVDDAGAEDGA